MKSRNILRGLIMQPEKEVKRIEESISTTISERMKKQGAVVALSGGIDSSTVAALCVRSLGVERVYGLLMPERESAEETEILSEMVVRHLGIHCRYIDITTILESLGCYDSREAAFRRIIPEYGPGWKAKIILPSILQNDRLSVFYLVAVSPAGRWVKRRLTRSSYLEILAATNYKQRVRKMLEYYFADYLNYAVVGSANRLEYDQGFFVKLGDGAADLKPIAHLYKTQVFQLAEYLCLPDEILNRPPTTDTYSMPQSQEEFYFSLPYEKMDICLYGKNHNYSMEEVAKTAGITMEQLQNVYHDIEQKRRASAYLHMPPQLVEEIEMIEGNNHVAKKAVLSNRL